MEESQALTGKGCEMQHVQKVVEILADRGKRRLPVERLYRHLWREDLLIQAYARIGKNDGATTPGIDSETVDGMNLEKIRLIGQVLQTNDWDWSPVRRVESQSQKVAQDHSEFRSGPTSCSSRRFGHFLNPITSRNSVGSVLGSAAGSAATMLSTTFATIGWARSGLSKGTS